ncbi:MAG: MBL fold metallo-hydrolase [archaeon]
MEVCALSSGSSGNCFLVSNGNNSILIDAGISCKKIEERMLSINKKVEAIKGIFVTHEHSDHIKGIDVFSRKFNVPIFASKRVIDESFLCSKEELICPIKKDENLIIGGMEVVSFSKVHKAVDPLSFTIIDNKNGKKVSIITDAGHVCNNIMENISLSNSLFIESNHDPEMLENGPYPCFLKKWIGGDTGHLSNMQSALSILENAKSKLKSVSLCHLSEHNNTPQLAMNLHRTMIKHRFDLKPKIFVSTKDSVSEIVKLT